MQSAIANMSNAFNNPDFTNVEQPVTDSNFWVLQWANKPDLKFNLWPLASDIMASIMEWFQFAVVWVCAYFSIQKMIDLLHDAVRGVGAFTRTQAPTMSVTVAGTGVQGSIWAHIPTMIILMGGFIAAMIAITSFITTFHAWQTIGFGINPLVFLARSGWTFLNQAAALIDSCLPVGQMCIDLAGYFVFRIFLIGTMTGLIGLWHFTPVWFLMAWLSSRDTEAVSDLVVNNASAEVVTVSVDGVRYLVGTNQAPRSFRILSDAVQVASGSWTTNYSIPDMTLASLQVGANDDGLSVVAVESNGPWGAFAAGTKIGGGLAAVMVGFYIVRLLKNGGETRIE
jgi:hypothetical protein